MNTASFWWLLLVVAKIIYFVDANWITGNLCWSMPCMNEGSCFGSAYTYLCVCPINFSGALCEKRLGICQESPCGNRGLCVETGLTSFECRCYFDYMGPLCEEQIPKNDPSLWSSLIPVHTRVLFDILQQAYHIKAQGRSVDSTNNGQIDFLGLLTKNGGGLLSSSLSTTVSPTLESTGQSETTEAEHVIRGGNIQLDKIFPEISTISRSDMYTNESTETTQQNEYFNETNYETNMTSTTMILTTEDITTTNVPLTTVENMITTSIEQNQTSSLNITEDQEFINSTEQSTTFIVSTPSDWSDYNSVSNTITYTTAIVQNLTEEINNSTEFEQTVFTTTPPETIDYTSSEINITTNYSSYDTEDIRFNSSEETMTSTLVTTEQISSTDVSLNTVDNTQSEHSQLLYKLCQQLLSHILPNASSSSATAAAAALSLVSDLPSTGNNTVGALLSWFKEQLNSTTTTTASSTLLSLLINEKKSSLIPLQRVDMDDVLYQMNNNIDSER